MRLFSTLFVITLISLSAQARDNHCDHGDGKATGTVVGGILGGVVGGLLGHGKAAPIIVGGVAGGAAGRAIGDGEDDRRDWDECGTDSGSFQRGVDRQERRDDERFDRDQRRQSEIEMDRELSRRDRDRGSGWGPGRGPGRGFPPPPPRRLRYQCQEARRGRFVLVELRSNRVVQEWGRDLYNCQLSERQANGF